MCSSSIIPFSIPFLLLLLAPTISSLPHPNPKPSASPDSSSSSSSLLPSAPTTTLPDSPDATFSILPVDLPGPVPGFPSLSMPSADPVSEHLRHLNRPVDKLGVGAAAPSPSPSPVEIDLDMLLLPPGLEPISEDVAVRNPAMKANVMPNTEPAAKVLFPPNARPELNPNRNHGPIHDANDNGNGDDDANVPPSSAQGKKKPIGNRLPTPFIPFGPSIRFDEGVREPVGGLVGKGAAVIAPGPGTGPAMVPDSSPVPAVPTVPAVPAAVAPAIAAGLGPVVSGSPGFAMPTPLRADSSLIYAAKGGQNAAQTPAPAPTVPAGNTPAAATAPAAVVRGAEVLSDADTDSSPLTLEPELNANSNSDIKKKVLDLNTDIETTEQSQLQLQGRRQLYKRELKDCSFWERLIDWGNKKCKPDLKFRKFHQDFIEGVHDRGAKAAVGGDAGDDS